MKLKILGGILLIAGTSIGGGMLALPIVTAKGGFLYSSELLIACWALMTFTAFLTLEVNLWFPKGHHIISMVTATLGKPGSFICWTFYLLFLYALVSAYIAGGRDILSGLLHTLHINEPMSIIAVLFTFFFGSIIFKGIRTVDYINRILMLLKFTFFFFLIYIILSHTSFSWPKTGHAKFLLPAMALVMTSFGFSIIIPTLRNYFDDNINVLRFVIFVGSLIPLIFYALWEYSIFSALPIYGAHGLANLSSLTSPITGLNNELIWTYPNPILFSHMPLHHFVNCASGQYNPIIGTFIASQDCSGRHYPFLLFRMLENPIASEFQTTIPILYSDFFRAAESLCRSDWSNMNLSNLQQKVNALNEFSIPAVRRLALETVVDKLNQFTVGDFKEGLRKQDPNFELACLLQNALSALNATKTQLDKLPPQGLRFPIPESSEQMVYVVFWLQLIESILHVKDARLQLFWNYSGEHHHASFTLYFNPIPTTYSPHFVDQPRQHENLIDITHAIYSPCSPGGAKRIPGSNKIVEPNNHTSVQINNKIWQSVQDDKLPLIKLIQRCGGE